MNPRFGFLFGVHCHQPVGNFRSVFERAFAEAYHPFLRTMLRHPAVKFTAHYSGPLLEFMETRVRECWDDLQELARRGQVELLGGGFYEPILPVIPEEDRQGQLRMMSDFLKERFGRRPRGIWLAERVWEPSLPKTLAAAGAEYTLVDEEHFHSAGIRDLHSYYLTEEEGSSLALFPIDKTLRYFVPFREPDKVLAYLAGIEARGGLAILGDDGEKFGLWPGTKKWVYEEGWLEKFLSLIEDRGLRTMTFAEALDSRPAAGRAYLPSGSYEEMTEWVLEPEAAVRFEELKRKASGEARRFVRGGFFREFFLKYPESHHLRSRMIDVSRRLREHGRSEALPELYKAQGNDPFWHGVFGGLYLPHLREAAYEHLLKAESSLPGLTTWREEDFDSDGAKELIWQDGQFGLFVKPSSGGSVVEIDHLPSARNLTDTLSRRPETYHLKQSPAQGEGRSIHERAKILPPGSERLLRYDAGPRRSFVDHFLGSDASPEKFRDLDFEELGDFRDGAFEAAGEGREVRLSRSGFVRFAGSEAAVRLEKRIVPGLKGIRFSASIKNESPEPLSLVFASEWNFYQTAGEMSVESGRIRLCQGRLVLVFAPTPEIWHFPLETLSQSEEGYDIIHQGFCVLPIWRVRIEPGASFEFKITLKGS
jgi:alpha-amylase